MAEQKDFEAARPQFEAAMRAKGLDIARKGEDSDGEYRFVESQWQGWLACLDSFALPTNDELPPLPPAFMDLYSPAVRKAWSDQMHGYAREALLADKLLAARSPQWSTDNSRKTGAQDGFGGLRLAPLAPTSEMMQAAMTAAQTVQREEGQPPPLPFGYELSSAKFVYEAMVASFIATRGLQWFERRAELGQITQVEPPEEFTLLPHQATVEMRQAAMNAAHACDLEIGQPRPLPEGYELWSAGFVFDAMMAVAPQPANPLR